MATDDPFLETRVASWDAGAATYDDAPRHGIRHDDEWVAWRRLLAAVLGDPAHADVPRLRVLDVGTGTGALALVVAELGHDVTGVDLSEGMLAEARRKALGSGLAVDLRVADAEALPAGLVGFDVILSRHLLWTLPHPERALRSWRMAARPGGLVAVIDGVHLADPWPLSWAGRAARAWLARREPAEVGHAYPPEVAAALPLAHQRDLRPVSRLLEEAGLEQIRIRPLDEIDRIERGHLSLAERLADSWRRYLATGRTPVITADAGRGPES